MISIGHMAKTYCILPSEVALRATTFDVMITDVYTTWSNYQTDKSSGRTAKTEDFDPEMLKSVMEKTKNVR